MMQPQEIMTGIIGDSIIHLIDIFPFFLFDYHMSGNNRTKVIKKQSCPYFHLDIFPLFRVEIYGTDYMLQFTERCFNPPPEPIEAFNLGSREGNIREIRNDILIDVIRNFKAKDPKRKRIFISRTMVDVVKSNFSANKTVLFFQFGMFPLLF